MRNLSLLFIGLIFSSHVFGFDFLGGKIEIPTGFQGPINQKAQGTTLIGFNHPHEGEDIATLLQITIWNPGQQFPNLSKEELSEGAKNYLLQFLSGVERRRENFEKGEVEFLSISDIPTAKITWRGVLNGLEVHGTMYALVSDSKIYNFHTQDAAKYEGKYTNLAEKAFENATLKR